MSITKSILENFELASGTEVYVQSNSNTISLSFDATGMSYAVTLSTAEAQQLADKLTLVIKERGEL